MCAHVWFRLRDPLTAAVDLIQPNSLYGKRITQIDLRFGQTLTAGRYRIKGMLDLYNVMNINTASTINTNYGTNGSSWLIPRDITLPHLVKIGAQIDF